MIRRCNRLSNMLLGGLLLATPLPAQTAWRVPSAFGGAMLGAGVGFNLDMLKWGMTDGCLSIDTHRQCGPPPLTITAVGIGTGALLGFIAGRRADRTISEGDTLSRTKRRWLRVATFLTPPAIGTAASVAIIGPKDQSIGIPDKVAAGTFIGGGAVLGLVMQRRLAGALWPNARVGIAPTARGATLTFAVSR